MSSGALLEDEESPTAFAKRMYALDGFKKQQVAKHLSVK